MEKHIILLVDDKPEEREIIKVYLEDMPYVFEEASDGASGLEKARQVLPDLILLDWKMPGITGMEVLKRLRAKRKYCRDSCNHGYGLWPVNGPIERSF